MAIRHGWTTAQDIHKEHIQQISQVCEGILRKMDIYSFEDYVAALEVKKYKVVVKPNNTGYAIIDGNTKYKGSYLESRHFTIPNLPRTLVRIHEEE